MCHAVGRVAASRLYVPDVLAPGPALRLLRHQPGARLGGGARALREPAQRLLAAPPRRRLHAAAASTRASSSSCSSSATGSRTPPTGRLPARAICGAATSTRPARARVASELEPRAIAFVGKEAYRGCFGERPELGPQVAHARLDRRSSSCPRPRRRTPPSPTPSGCAGFGRLHDWLEPTPRQAVRAIVVDARRAGAAAALREPGHAARLVGDPGRRASRRARATRRRCAASCSRRCGLELERRRARSSGRASTSSRGTASSAPGASASTSSGSSGTSVAPTIDLGGRARLRPPLVDARRARATGERSHRARSRPSCARCCARAARRAARRLG